MKWFYTEDGQSRGPVTPEEFQRLAAQGTITPQTLVWRQGMESWQAYASQVAPPPPAPAVPPPPVAALPAGQVACAGCGKVFPDSEVIPLAGRTYCATCKPLAIQRLKEGVAETSGADAIRHEHLKHEASVKSVGLLYYLGGAGLFLAGTASLLSLAGGTSTIEAGGNIATSIVLFLFSAGQIYVGTGLRGLKRWARIPCGILSSIGLIAFPIGTLINAYVLYLIFSKKGKMIFSDEYREVIAQTPHIKYRTSIVVWILLGLVVVLCGAAIVVPYFARR